MVAKLLGRCWVALLVSCLGLALGGSTARAATPVPVKKAVVSNQTRYTVTVLVEKGFSKSLVPGAWVSGNVQAPTGSTYATYAHVNATWNRQGAWAWVPYRNGVATCYVTFDSRGHLTIVY
jgi:hypothetical protein